MCDLDFHHFPHWSEQFFLESFFKSTWNTLLNCSLGKRRLSWNFSNENATSQFYIQNAQYQKSCIRGGRSNLFSESSVKPATWRNSVVELSDCFRVLMLCFDWRIIFRNSSSAPTKTCESVSSFPVYAVGNLKFKHRYAKHTIFYIGMYSMFSK